MENTKIGIIGLAVMGANLARNFASKGIKTAVFNRTFQRTKDLVDAHGQEGLVGFEKLADFVESLEKPRRIILMVQAGAAVDEVIDHLMPLVEQGDYIIDGGNSFFEDTERRHGEAALKGVNFLGMGISGGEEGALHGPSLMPGLSKADWHHFEDLLGQIAAKDFQGKPCVAPMGPGGAGHYVKMVHNGIEYAMMQMIAEIYDFNRKALGLKAPEIGELFEKINSGENSSFLAEITAKVLKHLDQESQKPLVDLILDKAAQKGTGGWTSIEAIKSGVPAEMISEAVAVRTLSALKSERQKLAQLVQREQIKSDAVLDWEAVYIFGSLIAYAQGLHLIETASQEHQWGVDLEEVCRIWQGGCIIRSKLLIKLRALMAEKRWWGEIVGQTDRSMQDFLRAGLDSSIALPASSSAFNYWLGLTSANSPANLIQGLRDFFGAHTFERIDKPGTFHENWTQ